MILGTSNISLNLGPIIGHFWAHGPRIYGFSYTKLLQKIRRPLEEGPPGCEGPARSSIFDLGLRWNHITALIFLDFHILDPLKGQSLISHVSCLMSQVLLDCLLSPKKGRIATDPLATQDLG